MSTPPGPFTIVNDLRAARAASTASWFEGVVHELELYDPAGQGGSMIWAVWFEAGSRAKPHIHSFDQTLHVVEGEGVLAVEGSAQRLVVGDWVTIPAGTWHWHGATPDSGLCHVTIQLGGASQWDVDRKDFDEYLVGDPR
jgi:quercetin dioxygenase-like cupin family protein